MNTKVNKIFDEIIKNLDLIKIESFESYKDVKINFPANYERKTMYKGVNAFNLLFFNLANGFDLEYFLTANQLMKIGNADFKGKKATQVKFFRLYYQNIKNRKHSISLDEYLELDENQKLDFEEKTTTKYSNVFNLQQLSNIEDLNFDFNSEESRTNKKLQLIETAENFVKGLEESKSLELFYSKVDSAKYSINRDRVIVPLYNDFKNEFHYYGTLFHELVHWSGGDKRLNRFNKGGTRNFDYNYEEFVAEIGSILLMLNFEISSNIYNSIAYIKIYLKKYSDEERVNILENAFNDAKKAVDYLLS